MTDGAHRSIPTFEEMTWPEIDAAIKAGAPIMLSTGATEQHGLHLPLGSDTMQGIEMSKRVAHRLKGEGIPLVVGPAIPFGPRPFLSESPKTYPGTINISNDLLTALLREVCSELIGQGFRTLYLVLANAESDPSQQIVAKELSETTEAQVITLNWLIGIRGAYKGLFRSTKPQNHGGEGETARMLATAPHLVRMEKARSYHPNYPAQPPIPEDRLPYIGGGVGRYKPPAGMFEGFEDGIVGDPQLATAETGEKVYGLVTDWMAEIVRREWALSRR
jgi:creatinine amidohydrolase